MEAEERKTAMSHDEMQDYWKTLCSFTGEDIPNEDILKSHTLSQLKEMFIAVYGQKPLSKDTKEDIISAIKKMMQQIDRAAGFKELENND